MAYGLLCWNMCIYIYSWQPARYLGLVLAFSHFSSLSLSHSGCVWFGTSNLSMYACRYINFNHIIYILLHKYKCTCKIYIYIYFVQKVKELKVRLFWVKVSYFHKEKDTTSFREWFSYYFVTGVRFTCFNWAGQIGHAFLYIGSVWVPCDWMPLHCITYSDDGVVVCM